MPKTITAAVLTNDTGAHLGAYFPALAASPEAGRVVLGDPSGKAVAGARRGLGKKVVKVYKDHGELLAAEKPEMALVSMESRVAPRVIRQALEAGCHVFAEKPMAVDGPGVRSVIETARMARERNLSLMSGFCWRYNVPNRECYQRLHDGAIGDIHTVHSTYLTGPLGKRRRSGGVGRHQNQRVATAD